METERTGEEREKAKQREVGVTEVRRTQHAAAQGERLLPANKAQNKGWACPGANLVTNGSSQREKSEEMAYSPRALAPLVVTRPDSI